MDSIRINITQVNSLTNQEWEKIFAYHKEHIWHNFPDSLYKKNLFKQQVQNGLKNAQSSFFFAKIEPRDTIAGFLWIIIEKDPYKKPAPYRYLDLHYIHVDKKHRNAGVGSALMNKTIQYALEKQCKEIRLGTYIKNIAAIKLYKKYDFLEYRITMRKFI